MKTYLGVDPSMGLSNALRITMAVIIENIIHITMKRTHTFLADRRKGIDHIPINVQSC
jgi:hypothetical protein